MNNKKKKSIEILEKARLFFITCFFMFIIVSFAHGDGAYILFKGGILAYEPSQSAVIGWNGTEEVLILSTNIHTDNSNSNWAIELIPFPSLPEPPIAGTLESITAFNEIIVSRIGNPEIGDVNIDKSITIVDALLIAQYYVGLKPTGFYKLTGDVDGNESVDIVDALLIAQAYVGLLDGFWNGRIDEIKVEFKDQIGVHTITVVQTENAAQLITFAEQVLAEVADTTQVQWDDFEQIAKNYTSRGINYWVIDLIDLDSTEKSRNPLIYSFKTSSLYFPLIVSSVNSGQTLIDIITITKNELDREAIESAGFEGMPINTYYEIVSPDFVDINSEIWNLFASISSTLKIGRHYFQGALKDLNKDLIVQER